MKLKKYMRARDATSMLKSEISKSLKRVKAAKYGHHLEDIVPPYSDEFYLPDKSLYFLESEQQQQQALAAKRQSRNTNLRFTVSRN
jgi:hypothetical protein